MSPSSSSSSGGAPLRGVRGRVREQLARGAQQEEHEASGGAQDGGGPGQVWPWRLLAFPRRQEFVAPEGTDKPPRQGFFHRVLNPSPPMASLKTHSRRRSRNSDENETSLSISLIDALEEQASDAEVQALLDAHPEAAKQVDCDGWLPLHLAAALQASGFVVQALLDAHPEGAKQEGSDGWLPLHLAVAFQATAFVVQALLVAHPEAAKQVDCDGWLPLHLAVAFEASDAVVKTLLDAHPEGAKQEGSDGWLPIHMAAAFQASDAVVKALLVANPSGAEGEGSGGYLPIHLAAALQSSDGADKEADLVLLAANPMGAKEKDCDGRIPLHYAAWTGASDAVVRALLAAHPEGAKEKDRTGRLPLNFALENKASDGVVQALLAVYSLDALYADDPFASVYKNGKLLLPCDVDVACVVTEEVLAALAQAQIRLLADLEKDRPQLADFLRETESGETSQDWRRRAEIGRQSDLASLQQKRGDVLGEGGEEISTTRSSLEIRINGDKLSPGRRVTPPHPMPHLPHTMPQWTHAPLEGTSTPVDMHDIRKCLAVETPRRIEFSLDLAV